VAGPAAVLEAHGLPDIAVCCSTWSEQKNQFENPAGSRVIIVMGSIRREGVDRRQVELWLGRRADDEVITKAVDACG